MFTLHFEKLPRQLHKQVKGLKNKKGHTIHEAEELIGEIQAVIDSDIKVSIRAKDLNGDEDLEFEEMTIQSNGSPVGLISHLVNEIADEDSDMDEEEIEQLIQRFETQYSEEQEFDQLSQSGVTSNKQSQNLKKKPTGFGLKQLFGKKRSRNAISESLAEDFSELEQDLVTDEEDEDPYKEEFIEATDQEQLFDNSDHDEYSEDEDALGNEDLEDEDVDMFASEKAEVNPFEEETDNWHTDSLESEVKAVPKKKNESVEFMSFDDYVDLSRLSETIQRHKRQLSESALLKLLNLPVSLNDTELSELDKKKITFAMNQLNDSTIQEMIQKFKDSTESLEEKAKLNLAQKYEETLLEDYESSSKTALEEEREYLEISFNNDVEEFEENEQETLELKVSSFFSKQEKELEAFKREQALEKEMFVQELESKRDANIELFRQDKNEKLDHQFNHLLDEEMYREKQAALSGLRSLKNSLISEFDVQLSVGSQTVKENLLPKLKAIREEMIEKESEWTEEIDRKHLLKQKEEELALERKKIEVMESDVEVRNLELNSGTLASLTPEQKQIKELEEKIDRLFTYSYAIPNHSSFPSEPFVSQSGVQNEVANEKSEPNDLKKNNGSRKNIFIAGGVLAGIIFVLGTGWAIGRNGTSEYAPAPSAESRSQYDDSSTNSVHASTSSDELDPSNLENNRDRRIAELELQIESFLTAKEEGASSPESETKELKTIEDLLSAGAYDEAVNLAESNGDYELIVNAMAQQNALDELVKFNQVYRTSFGEVFESLLKQDTDQVAKLVQEMEDDTLANLPQDKKNELALLLFQNEQESLANSVLTATSSNEK